MLSHDGGRWRLQVRFKNGPLLGGSHVDTDERSACRRGCGVPACPCRAGAGAVGAPRHRGLRPGRPDGGRPGQRQEAGLHHHRDGGERRQGRIRLPGGAAGARQLPIEDTRDRLRARRCGLGRACHRQTGHRRSQAQARARHLRPAHQFRVADQRTRPRRAQARRCSTAPTAIPPSGFSNPSTPARISCKVFERMGGYYPGASDLQPQRLVGAHRRPPVNPAMAQSFADYLAALNLSAKPVHGFDFKTTPRPSGRATRVIVTEYDLPRKEIQPHDVVVDPDGGVWFSHFGEQFLSKLDPKTGKVTDYPIQVFKPDHPKGTLDLEVDPDGNIWVALMYQSGMARFDRKTEKFRYLPVPQGVADRRHPAVALLGGGHEGRRQGLGEEHRPFAGPEARSRDRRLREPRLVQGPGHRPADRHLRHLRRPAEQRLHPRIRQRRHRQDRCQDRQVRVLPDADAVLAGAARPRRCAEPAVVRRVRRRMASPCSIR